MAKKSWTFNLDGRSHTLNFEQGLSGKKKIFIDGNLAYENRGLMDMTREFPFEIEGHSVVLLIKPGIIDSFDLMVDDRSADTGRIGPARVKVEETAEGLKLVYRGGRGVFSILLVFALIFMGVSAMGFYSSISGGSLNLADMMYLPILFPLIGLALAYFSLVKMLNKTVLTAGPAGVSVKQGPVPWFGNRELHTADIEKVYCESYERKSSSGQGAIGVTVTSILYRLCAKLNTGKKVVLLSDLDQCYEALFVNRQLGRKLGRLVQPELQNA